MSEARESVAEAVRAVMRRIEKEVHALLECIHGRQADQCSQCAGRTAKGVPLELMLGELTRQGLIHVQPPTDEAGAARPPSRRPASMKTMVGAGIGATFFLAFVGWQGGKLIWRLVGKGKGNSASPRA